MTDLESEMHERFVSGSLVEPLTPLGALIAAAKLVQHWRTVDIDPSVDSSELDGIEAALTASGLIDAWIRPDGGVDLERADVHLVATPLNGETLRSILVPMKDVGLDPDLIDRVLRSIRIVDTVYVDHAAYHGSSGLEIGRDGSFRVGTAVGHGRLQEAELLGAEARERRRLARLAELDQL